MRDNKALVRRFYEVMWNTWDESAVPAVLAPEVDFRGSIGLRKHGHAGVMEYMRLIRDAFPDFNNRIDDLVAEDEKVVARLTFTGTHLGQLLEHAATGRKVTYCGAAFFEMANGKIRQVWVLGDALSLMRQIGAVE
ncbi:MAG TPA: ester cyclase [bacterium]|nr:ester cyclase [bacterium]